MMHTVSGKEKRGKGSKIEKFLEPMRMSRMPEFAHLEIALFIAGLRSLFG
jgi:hypothetical protein